MISGRTRTVSTWYQTSQSRKVHHHDAFRPLYRNPRCHWSGLVRPQLARRIQFPRPTGPMWRVWLDLSRQRSSSFGFHWLLVISVEVSKRGKVTVVWFGVRTSHPTLLTLKLLSPWWDSLHVGTWFFFIYIYLLIYFEVNTKENIFLFSADEHLLSCAWCADVQISVLKVIFLQTRPPPPPFLKTFFLFFLLRHNLIGESAFHIFTEISIEIRMQRPWFLTHE